MTPRPGSSPAPAAEPAPWTFAGESARVDYVHSLTLVEGASFVICRRTGDIEAGIDGVYVGDTRICSRLVLVVDGRRPEPLASTVEEASHGVFVSRVASRSLLVQREHRSGRGARVDLRVRNLAHEPTRVSVAYAIGSDLADLFEVKELRASGRGVPSTVDGDVLVLGDRGSRRATVVRPSPAPTLLEPGVVGWDIALEAGGEWSSCLELRALRSGEELEPLHPCGAPPSSPEVTPFDTWPPGHPLLRTDVPGLERAFLQSTEDLDALRISDPEVPGDTVVAAGAPWYMTLFGRDSLLTAWMALPLDQGLALSTVRTLARLQGAADDALSEEQPGRILHEIRADADASLAFSAGSIYYGSVDATPLFVMLVHELWRWGVPFDALRPLLPHVDAALGWMAGPGDADGDGYLEYHRTSPSGLANQGWKDSWDGISFADGRLPESPIALAEVQAYAYAAWSGGAALANAVGDHQAAASRRARAFALREWFHRDFWLPDRGWYAMALDADKQPVDALASNMGHCLWAGIVEPEHSAAVARWLVDPVLASGWGLRTLATTMGRYDPLSYHNGSVWPHDTAIAIAGLRRYGHDAEAMVLTTQLLRAAEACGGRLPELFSGLTPEELAVPVPYPASCSPQAWASAAPLLLARALLGLQPDLPGKHIELDPVLPDGGTRLELDGIPIAGATVSVEVDGDAVALRGLPRGLAIVRPATGTG